MDRGSEVKLFVRTPGSVKQDFSERIFEYTSKESCNSAEDALGRN